MVNFPDDVTLPDGTEVKLIVCTGNVAQIFHQGAFFLDIMINSHVPIIIVVFLQKSDVAQYSLKVFPSNMSRGREISEIRESYNFLMRPP